MSEISPDVVGVSVKHSAANALGQKVKARKKLARNGQGAAGVTRAPSFSVSFDGKLLGKYEGAWKNALPDIKHKRPGEYMTEQLLSCLLDINKQKILRRSPTVAKAYEVTKFTAKYTSD